MCYLFQLCVMHQIYKLTLISLSKSLAKTLTGSPLEMAFHIEPTLIVTIGYMGC